jgi:putative mRNA 3-end processing factor
MDNLLRLTDKGLYCEAGDFYIDPIRSVERAIITHGHSDHARYGSRNYLSHRLTIPVLLSRLGSNASYHGMEYGERLLVNGVSISLHPAGHIPGSAQVRIEKNGEIWVVTGDYKIQPDNISTSFEIVRCSVLISECTFGLPIFQWTKQSVIAEQINHWWRRNAAKGVTSVLLCYSLGKAQRILAMLDENIGPIMAHGATFTVTELLREHGVSLPRLELVTGRSSLERFRSAMILAPASALGTPWMKKFEPYEFASASGWMTLRGVRKRLGCDQAFILSDHVDWPGLQSVVQAISPERLYFTHGYTSQAAKWFCEQGFNAKEFHDLKISDREK